MSTDDEDVILVKEIGPVRRDPISASRDDNMLISAVHRMLMLQGPCVLTVTNSFHPKFYLNEAESCAVSGVPV